MAYDDISDHLMMLSDKLRNDAYQKAIQEVVQAGDTVLDFGCGSGVLSLFAERAGAGKVYAVDRSIFIHAARKIAEQNHARHIEFIRSSGEDLQINDQVDVLVSEWMGHFLFWEWMLDPFLKIRDRYLKEGGAVIPARASMHCALVTNPREFERLSYFQQPVNGLNYEFVRDWPYCQPQLVYFSENDVTPEQALLSELDLQKIEKTPGQVSARLQLAQGTTCYGICGWFSTTLAEGAVIDTAPSAPRTHWHHVYFPFNQPLEVVAGEPVEVDLFMQCPTDARETLWRWRARHRGKTIELNNFSHPAWLVLQEHKMPSGE